MNNSVSNDNNEKKAELHSFLEDKFEYFLEQGKSFKDFINYIAEEPAILNNKELIADKNAAKKWTKDKLIDFKEKGLEEISNLSDTILESKQSYVKDVSDNFFDDMKQIYKLKSFEEKLQFVDNYSNLIEEKTIVAIEVNAVQEKEFNEKLSQYNNFFETEMDYNLDRSDSISLEYSADIYRSTLSDTKDIINRGAQKFETVKTELESNKKEEDLAFEEYKEFKLDTYARDDKKQISFADVSDFNTNEAKKIKRADEIVDLKIESISNSELDNKKSNYETMFDSTSDNKPNKIKQVFEKIKTMIQAPSIEKSESKSMKM